MTGSVAGVSSSSEGFEPKIAVTSDALWVSDAAENRVTRVDSRRLRVAYRGKGGGNGVAVGSGGVWSAEGFTDVVRYANGRAARIHVGGGPIDVALTTGAVWTVTRFGRTLVRIDPARDRIVRRIPLGGTPVAVTAGGGLVAVALR